MLAVPFFHTPGGYLSVSKTKPVLFSQEYFLNTCDYFSGSYFLFGIGTGGERFCWLLRCQVFCETIFQGGFSQAPYRISDPLKRSVLPHILLLILQRCSQRVSKSFSIVLHLEKKYNLKSKTAIISQLL